VISNVGTQESTRARMCENLFILAYFAILCDFAALRETSLIVLTDVTPYVFFALLRFLKGWVKLHDLYQGVELGDNSIQKLF